MEDEFDPADFNPQIVTKVGPDPHRARMAKARVNKKAEAPKEAPQKAASRQAEVARAALARGGGGGGGGGAAKRAELKEK